MNTSQIVGTVFITILFVLIGYLLGSIIFGPIVAKRFKKDLTNIASGNVGGTNVIRAIGRATGVSVMLLDGIKGYVAIAISFLIYRFSIYNWTSSHINICLILVYLSGTFAVIGHCYPIQYVVALLKFKGDKEQARKYKGGKGVATTGGVLFAVSPWLGLIAFGMFVVILLIARCVSIASMTCMALTVFLVWVPKIMFLYMFDPHWTIQDWDWPYKLMIMVLLLYNAIIVIFRHKENIIRLIHKEERKIF